MYAHGDLYIFLYISDNVVSIGNRLTLNKILNILFKLIMINASVDSGKQFIFLLLVV